MSIVEVTDLIKRYGKRNVVDGVSLSVEEGEIFAILGPNGAGKTTTVEIIEGLRAADGGNVTVMGLDPRRDRRELRLVLGAQLQASRLPDKLRVGEALELYRSFYPHPADTDDLLERLGLTEQRGTAFQALSGGQQQRVSIALALIGNPRVAVLDELTTGLDPQARRATWDLIEQVRDSGVTILLVTHFMDEAERLSDRLAILDRGRIVAIDTPSGLVASVDAQQRIHFRPSEALDDALLAGLPSVTSVARRGGEVLVTGTGDVLHEVTSVLARNRIIAHDLRIERTSLDDAFVSLTGRPLEV
ncbi:MAG TPA: ABC transporter ATP-binding protein [Euzebyales bacterium]|nr:ABC transporter ATP-binding protein [Euzebyales bacterium]